jgi:hypothetical protein
MVAAITEVGQKRFRGDQPMISSMPIAGAE